MRRKTVVIAGGVALLLLGVVLALPYIVNVNRYRPQLETAIEDRLGREVTLGHMQLSLIPVGLRVDDVVIGEDPALRTQRPFARVEQLYVGPKILPLLRGQFELRSVELRDPVVELVRKVDGAWNFATLGAARKADGESPSLVLDSLVLTSGEIAMTDLTQAAARAASKGSTAPDTASRAVYDDIDVQIQDYGPERAFRMLVAATLPGEGDQRVSIEGTAGPVAQDNVAMTPFEGTVTLVEVSVSGAQRFLRQDALEGTDAVISGRADLRNRDGVMASKGALTLEGTRVRGVDIGYPIATEFDVSHDANTRVLTMNQGTLRLDQTPLSATGTVDLAPDVPLLDVHVTASDASLAEAARLASAFGVAFGAGTQVQGRLNADVRARGPADRPALDGQVRLRSVSISGTDIPQPVKTDAVDLTLTPEEIRSNEFTAATGGTSLGVRAAVSRYTSARPTVDARIHTENADLGEVLDVARAWGAGADGVSGTGRITIDVRATGPTDALSLSGSGGLKDATLKAPSITQPLRITSANVSFNRDAAVLQNLSASIGKTTANGRLSVRSFSAPQVEFELSVDAVDVKELQSIVAGSPQSKDGRAAPGDGVLLRTTGGGRLRVGSITYDQLVLENVQATATLDKGVIRLDPLTAALYGGQHRGAIAADMRTAPMTVTVASELDKVDANRLASAATSVRDVIFGALGTQVRVSFAGEGADGLARSLNGTMSLNLAEGRIANMDLTHEIGNIARFVSGQAPAERSTGVAGLTGHFDINNGVARTEDLTASIEGGTMSAAGTINLADQTLNLRLTTVLSREYSSRVGGTRVGGFMATALANQQGELVVPLLVTGTMQRPRFAPDAQRVAEMKVKNLVPSLRDPKALTSGILGAITGGQKEGQPPRSGVGDILGAITGRDKPAAPANAPADANAPPAPAQPEANAKPAPPEANAKPAPPDRGKAVQDALRDLLRGRKPEEEKKTPPEPAPEPAK